MALEIRVLDAQECPSADLAIAFAVSQVLQSLCEGGARTSRRLRELETRRLSRLLVETTARAGAAKIDDGVYLTAVGLDATPRSARDAWQGLLERYVLADRAASEFLPGLDVIVDEGCLAERLLQRAGGSPGPAALKDVYRELAGCLSEEKLFRGRG